MHLRHSAAWRPYGLCPSDQGADEACLRTALTAGCQCYVAMHWLVINWCDIASLGPLVFTITITLMSLVCGIRAQELRESRGGRPGLPSLINLRFLWTLQPTCKGILDVSSHIEHHELFVYLLWCGGGCVCIR